jgi:hypothetical protein
VGSSGRDITAWAVKGPGPPDLATVNAIARWQLSARRAGGCIRLQDPSEALTSLLELVGLLGEVGGEPEAGEQLLCVEEGVQSGDPIT